VVLLFSVGCSMQGEAFGTGSYMLDNSDTVDWVASESTSDGAVCMSLDGVEAFCTEGTAVRFVDGGIAVIGKVESDVESASLYIGREFALVVAQLDPGTGFAGIVPIGDFDLQSVEVRLVDSDGALVDGSVVCDEADAILVCG